MAFSLPTTTFGSLYKRGEVVFMYAVLCDDLASPVGPAKNRS